jgi:structural maintenance of chromosome 1
VSRKLNNAAKTKEDVTRSEGTISSRLEALRKELASTKKAAEKAQEEQRKASRQNLALSEESLDEYRKLSVFHMYHDINTYCDVV